jgi:hypothetical protein
MFFVRLFLFINQSLKKVKKEDNPDPFLNASAAVNPWFF